MDGVPDELVDVLPSFEDIRREAHRLLVEAQRWLRSDIREGSAPSQAQTVAFNLARRLIFQAKEALSDAADHNVR
jgi:hypothetical protein